MNSAPRAFTLIEMLGVIAIMALLSSAASIMLSGSRHKADLQQAVEQFEQADVSARSLARSSDGSVTLSIELASGTINRNSDNSRTMLAQLPGDVKIQRTKIANEIIDYGSTQLAFDSAGHSVSYAVKLASSSGESEWVVFAGLTGQMLKVSDEEIDAISDAISPRADAH